MKDSKHDISEASIVDLKAELYKKELEVKQKGIGLTTEAVVHKKSKTLQKIAANTGKFKLKIIGQKPLTEPESDKLKEVQEKLDAKSRLYDKLKEDAKKGIKHDKLSDAGILVDFDKKAYEDKEPTFFDIIQSAEAEHREKMNLKWEEEREKLKEKPAGQHHYQDVIITRARRWLLSFSTEEDRSKQMELLNTLRKDTIGARERNMQIKEKRERAMAERISKIRKRKGLPEIEEKPEPQLPEKISIDEEIEEIIQDSKKDEYYETLSSKLRKYQDDTEEYDERPDEFAPPSEYAVKYTHAYGYRKRR
ncbi:Coiled-coil domain-containing protein 174 [Thelohanellus kitauei]|uniref:Coiled-coil domain-containing protein 174 n=1 Tax=Thelohanellus kitauei TaxID=669202 RepID=A0A0C2JAN8_THEKT|nr:Coiled-coil domain-containing protein 174 [Thelohanellus kitauei]